MLKKIYRRTIVDEIIEYLYTDNILVLHGARQVGKTYLLYWLKDYLRKKNEITYYIDLEDSRFVKILDSGHEEFIKHLIEEGIISDGKNFSSKRQVFVFVDEIQYLNNPSSFLKLIADHYKNIKLIVSGSSSFDIKNKFKNSLVGRTVEFEIFPLSFKEFLLFQEHPFNDEKKITSKKLEELKKLYKKFILYGGYPQIALTAEVKKKEKYLQQIIDTYIKKDIRDLADIREVGKFNKLLEILASQSGNLLNVTELSNTCGIAKQTVEKYLFIMKNTYVIKLVQPYYNNIRSELFKTSKIYFYDTGLMQMLWLKELQKQVIGNVFETAVFSELIKKYGKNTVFYWRTKDRKEIDFVLKIKNMLLPIEAKLNFEQANLRAIKYFNEKYGTRSYRIAGIDGSPKSKFCVYPWQL